MTTTNDDRRRSETQSGWLKVNRFKERGFGILEADDGHDVFCHLYAFLGIETGGITEDEIHRLEYGRRVRFRLSVDPKRGRAVARDVVPLPEIQVPDGTIIVEPPARGNKVREQDEAERAAKRTGFGALVSQLR